jgi:hypothetical protein
MRHITWRSLIKNAAFARKTAEHFTPYQTWLTSWNRMLIRQEQQKQSAMDLSIS